MERSGEHHGLIGAETGKALIAPMGGELRRQLGVIFLQADVRTSIFQLSNDHGNLLTVCFAFNKANKNQCMTNNLFSTFAKVKRHS
jgi:hypothetical protein